MGAGRCLFEKNRDKPTGRRHSEIFPLTGAWGEMENLNHPSTGSEENFDAFLTFPL